MTVLSLYWSSHHPKATPPTAADIVYAARLRPLESLDALESDEALEEKTEAKRRNVCASLADLTEQGGRAFGATREASRTRRGIITHGALEGRFRGWQEFKATEC